MRVSKWSFFGRMLPEWIPVTWHTPLEGSGESPLGFSYAFRVAIRYSQIMADIEVTKGSPDLFTIRNEALHCVRMITDLIGYQLGCWFDVEIISAVSQETSDWRVFEKEIPVLASQRRAKATGTGAIDGRLFHAIGTNAAAQITLADFREAMRMPVGTGFFCYRAIEAMMQSMKMQPEENEKKVSWPRLRGILRIDRSALDEIKQHADLPRHGMPSAITDAERAKVFQLTDEIIRRFLEYLVRGKGALPTEGFPILKSDMSSG